MKTIGIIGGMSWQSSVEYYIGLNELSEAYGNGFSTVDIILYSLNFNEIESLQSKGDWEGVKERVLSAALNLEKAGADFLIIASNTIHKILPKIKGNLKIPFISIIDAIAEEIKRKRIDRVALFGTRFTMEEDFYKDELGEKSEAEILIPDKDDRRKIDGIIYNELTKNIIKKESKEAIKSIINKMMEKGAKGVILGCTELPLIISQEDSPVYIFNSTEIHIRKSFQFSLGN